MTESFSLSCKRVPARRHCGATVCSATLHAAYMAPHAPTITTWLILLPLLAWRLRARYKRLVGRQRTNKYRPWVSIGIYSLLLALLCWMSWGQWGNLATLVAGVGCGSLLSRWAWKKTTLEPTAQGLFYTPHTWLGLALMGLFLARIAYRVVELMWLHPEATPGLHGFVASPLTMGVFGLMAGHTMGYSLALFNWRQRVLAAKKTS